MKIHADVARILATRKRRGGLDLSERRHRHGCALSAPAGWGRGIWPWCDPSDRRDTGDRRATIASVVALASRSQLREELQKSPRP